LQLRAVYRGEILDWGAFGGLPEEPLIISREDGSGTRAAFEALVMVGDRVTLNALVMPTSEAVVDYVAGHRAAIGYVSMAALTDTVRALPVEDMLPSPENVRSGAYHLSRLLYFYAPEPMPPASQAFVDFVLSPAGQTIVGRYHVPLRER
jgi:phosphate transport system substrate-binding protein